jgi:hypothetical protein
MSKAPRASVLLQRADGSGEVKSLPGPFTPVMVTSEQGAVRTYRFVDFGYDADGQRHYTYVEDETLTLPVEKPSEIAQLQPPQEDPE